MNRLALLALASGLIACGGGTKTDTAASANPCGDNPCGDNPCGDNPCGGDAVETGVDWTSWQSWTQINSKAFVSKGHKKPWVNVYVLPEHAEAYKKGGEMPQGMAVVKSIHEEVEGVAGDVKTLTVMAKMGPDYDPENGNWYYAVISADGSEIKSEGKMEACLNCHGTGDDYLFASQVVGH